MRERMSPHPLDGFSLVAGVLFVVLGALVLVDVSSGHDVDARWMLAALLVGLGLAGVLGSLDLSRADDSDPDRPVPPTPEEDR